MKIFYKILIISLFFFPQTKVNAGAATEYKITMTLLELCDSTSTLTACNNPVVIGSGDKEVDIASVDAGASAAAYGQPTLLPLGETYTHLRVTIDKKFTLKI